MCWQYSVGTGVPMLEATVFDDFLKLGLQLYPVPLVDVPR